MGYHRAGFDVYGVDLHQQRNYPFAMTQGEASQIMGALIAGYGVEFVHPDGRIELLRLRDFAALHASPPCQGYTEMVAPGQVGAPRLVAQTRDDFRFTGLPWIIENVEGARWAMESPIMLCGSMFGLGAQGCQLQRHRLFEASFDLTAPSCAHDSRPVIGVYGGHARRRAASAGGRGTRDVWEGGHRAAMSEAMGITWATCAEMSEAIPPAYTEFLGRQMLAHVAREDMADLLS